MRRREQVRRYRCAFDGRRIRFEDGILELEWVLRYVADQPGVKVIECLAELIALPGVAVEDRDEIQAAISHCRCGVAFADALHLAVSKSCRGLLTFDRESETFVRRVRPAR